MTTCPRCLDTGMLCVFVDPTTRQTSEPFCYQSSAATDYAARHPEKRSTIMRCSCPAGDAPRLPKRWPRWGGEVDAPDTRGLRQAGDHTMDDTEDEVPF